MGRTLAGKKELVSEMKDLLGKTQMAIVMDYAGLTVAETTDLRTRLFEKGATCKIAKNTLVQKAIDGDENWMALSELLKGTNAFILVEEDLGGAIKAYKEFQKASKKSEIRGGILEGKVLTPKQVDAIGDLPSKEQLMAQIACAINGVATKLAIGINEIPTSLARAVKAVSEKDAA
jgi:large subunit ribosomal protein L10